ncbi:unnamed protein product [Moneuplotes crassus]|uniref:Uncharacterized protein n=1 Tax=Euplotes crassus TaxID=5936 RepID=A0AAD2D968_EUPCR|nr:unnamed protein product [Moneuplotes crassus]
MLAFRSTLANDSESNLSLTLVSDSPVTSRDTVSHCSSSPLQLSGEEPKLLLNSLSDSHLPLLSLFLAQISSVSSFKAWLTSSLSKLYLFIFTK